MVASFTTLQMGQYTVDCLSGCDLRVQICRRGAELVSLQKAAPGASPDALRGFLYRDGLLDPPAAGWGNHATVMGYYIHRLWGQKSLYRGREISGGNHGFLRHFEFGAPAFDPGDASLTYEVPSARIPPAAYPLKVRLSLAYRMTPKGELEVEFDFFNEEAEAEAHLSFGLHPGIGLTKRADARVLLPPGRYVRHNAPGNFLDGTTVAFDHPGGDMPFADAELPGSILLGLEGVRERVFAVEDPASARRTVLDFRDCPYLTLWSEGDDYLCVEPCWGLPDSNPPTAFERKPGIQVIPPMSSLKKSFTIRPEFLT